MMSPYSQKQKKAAGMDLARVRAGKRPRVMKGATEEELRHMAAAPIKKAAKPQTMKHKPHLKRRTG